MFAYMVREILRFENQKKVQTKHFSDFQTAISHEPDM